MADDKPNLGLATTEEMFRELICRFSISYKHDDVGNSRNINRALVLSEMLGGMNATEKEYSTVNGD